MTGIRLPNISASADMQTQMAQMRSYMYQMVEQLNWALSAMDGGAQAQEQQLPGQTTVPASDNKKEDDTNQRMANLRDLIIKSADVVRQEMDRLATELKGSYVAQSEFGDYLERISQRIEADPSQLSQYFKFASDIRADVDRVEVDFASYKTDVEGYIRQGIVGYDGTVPIIGIAIGQDIRTSQTGVETEQGVYDVIVILHRRAGDGIFLQRQAYCGPDRRGPHHRRGGMGRELHQRREIQMDRRMRKWPPAALSAQTQNTAHAFG